MRILLVTLPRSAGKFFQLNVNSWLFSKFGNCLTTHHSPEVGVGELLYVKNPEQQGWVKLHHNQLVLMPGAFLIQEEFERQEIEKQRLIQEELKRQEIERQLKQQRIQEEFEKQEQERRYKKQEIRENTNQYKYQHQLVRKPPATQIQTENQHKTRKSSIKRPYNSSTSYDRLNKIIQFLNSNNDLRLRRKIINQMHIIMGKSAANERLQAFERVEDIIKNNVK